MGEWWGGNGGKSARKQMTCMSNFYYTARVVEVEDLLSLFGLESSHW